MRTFVTGLFCGAAIGAFIASVIALDARARRLEDAAQLADRLEEDERLEREFSG